MVEQGGRGSSGAAVRPETRLAAIRDASYSIRTVLGSSAAAGEPSAVAGSACSSGERRARCRRASGEGRPSQQPALLQCPSPASPGDSQ
jgi:hypothetical protein